MPRSRTPVYLTYHLPTLACSLTILISLPLLILLLFLTDSLIIDHGPNKGFLYTTCLPLESCIWIRTRASSVKKQSGNNMDPADSEAIRRSLQFQSIRLAEREAALPVTNQHLHEICARLESWLASQANAAATPTMVTPPVAPSPPVPPVTECFHASITPLSRPECFSGDSGKVNPFLAQCNPHFELQASAFPTDRSRIAFVISHMTGRAEVWATAEWIRNMDDVRLCAHASIPVRSSGTQGGSLTHDNSPRPLLRVGLRYRILDPCRTEPVERGGSP
ncbi:uncharacterized protein LOC133514034 [Syngnathoides biaculeatus]|uniref:uncharacterized protein LOC133514034 n=1 Tax=Syngnathoides biaculeatus TaxID=300417 RepID=UPI002ADDDAA0|nr:uncharacterized protein LOC133514034 [Syngnathoides biaculeatus]